MQFVRLSGGNYQSDFIDLSTDGCRRSRISSERCWRHWVLDQYPMTYVSVCECRAWNKEESGMQRRRNHFGARSCSFTAECIHAHIFVAHNSNAPLCFGFLLRGWRLFCFSVYFVLIRSSLRLRRFVLFCIPLKWNNLRCVKRSNRKFLSSSKMTVRMIIIIIYVEPEPCEGEKWISMSRMSGWELYMFLFLYSISSRFETVVNKCKIDRTKS